MARSAGPATGSAGDGRRGDGHEADGEGEEGDDDFAWVRGAELAAGVKDCRHDDWRAAEARVSDSVADRGVSEERVAYLLLVLLGGPVVATAASRLTS